MNRRAFCYSSMGGLLASVARAGDRGSSVAERVRVPSHLWVYAARLPGHDATSVLDQVFADMKYAGIDGVELMENVLRHPDAVERIGALVMEHDLPVTGTSYYADMWDASQRPRILEDAELVLTRLAALGGRTFGTTVGEAPARKTEEQLDVQAEVVARIDAMASAHGIVQNLHNHTFEVVDDLYDLRGTLERLPDVKLGPDLNWLVRAGVDPVWFIDTYGDRIVYLHLRDQHANGRWSEALGEGDTDFSAIAEALERAGFKGDAAVELAHESDFVPTRPLRESLRMSRTFVRETFGF